MHGTVDFARVANSAITSLDALINSARRAEQDGDWAEAERAYTRAIERTQAGDGSVYLVVVTATDTFGNASRECHTVVVPKKKK